MMAALAAWLAGSSALILLAWIAAGAARALGASASLRHLIWLLAIAATALLPVMSTLTPWRVALPAFAEAPASAGVAGSGAAPGWSWTEALYGLYAFGVAALLLRLAAGQRRLGAMWRAALRVESIAQEAAAIAAALGLRREVGVRAGGVSTPLMWGAAAPKILLPPSAMDWPAPRRRLVLMHELTHVMRGDGAVQLLVSLMLAVCWFHPALWFAATRLRREQEQACDERVLRSGAAPDAYAQALLDVAAAQPLALPALGMASPSELEARLTAVVGPRARALSAGGAAAVTACACALLLGAAALTPVAPARAAEPLAPTPPVSEVAEVAPLAQTAEQAAPDAAPPAPIARIEQIEDLADLADRETPRPRRDHVREPAPPSPITPAPAIPAIPAQPAELPAIPLIPAIAELPASVTTPAPHRPERRGAKS